MHNAKSLVLLYYGFYPQLMAGWMAMAMVGDRRNCNQLRNDGYFGIEGRQPQGMHCTAAIFLSICLKSYWITKKRIFGRFDLRCALQFFFLPLRCTHIWVRQSSALWCVCVWSISQWEFFFFLDSVDFVVRLSAPPDHYYNAPCALYLLRGFLNSHRTWMQLRKRAADAEGRYAGFNAYFFFCVSRSRGRQTACS